MDAARMASRRSTTLAAWWIGLSLTTAGFGKVRADPPPVTPAPATAPRQGSPVTLTFMPLEGSESSPRGQMEDSGSPSAYGAPGSCPPSAAPSPSGPDVKVLPINLPTALRLANASNPTIAAARVRVEEAYSVLRAAEVSWLPNLQGGATYVRHDGNLQNAGGLVFTVSKQNLFVGGGAAMAWQTSDIVFGPRIARQLLQAQNAASQAVNDNVQLDVALTYLDLLRTYGALAVNAETLAKAEQMLRSAETAERAGLGKTTADPNRARTEVRLRREEGIDLQGEVATFSARLAQLLLMEPTADLQPSDPTIIPIVLVPESAPLGELVAAGLMSRPELAESRALVAAALARWRQSKIGPFLPRLELDYSAGDFGGGINDALGHWDGRGDGLAQATWELHNFGFGDRYRAQAERGRYTEANLRVVEVEAEVSAEVSAAAKVARARARALQDAQAAVQQAEEMWRRLEKAAFGLTVGARQYDPLEPLLAEQALHQARMQYLTEVTEYNKSQFRLYWAMGQPPLSALPKACALPVQVPTLPAAPAPANTLGMPAPVAAPKR